MANENDNFLNYSQEDHPYRDGVELLNEKISGDNKEVGARITKHFSKILEGELDIRDHTGLYTTIKGKRQLPGDFKNHIQGIDR